MRKAFLLAFLCVAMSVWAQDKQALRDSLSKAADELTVPTSG